MFRSALSLLALSRVPCLLAAWPDCDSVNVKDFGPFGDMTQLNATDEEGKQVFIFHPPLNKGPYPVMVFSHGVTGEWAMYEDAYKRYVSHGFVVVFPHVKSPKDDVSAFTTDPMGKYTTRGFNFAKKANADASSPLHGALDLSNIVLVGHSMGATATLMAAHHLPVHSVKLAYAQHPGICGPYGPPPCLPGSCNTWMPADFQDVSSKVPVILSTATNDGAFWPAPYTAEHEFGCFNKSTDQSPTKDSTAYVQFKESVCLDDGKGGRYGRHWSNGGHDCPMLSDSPETPWVLTAAKLYAQLGGDSGSKCHSLLWGDSDSSLQKDPNTEKVVVNLPKDVVVV